MQNRALWGFSAEQLWQRINAPVAYATPSFFITLRRVETIARARAATSGPGRRLPRQESDFTIARGPLKPPLANLKLLSRLA